MAQNIENSKRLSMVVFLAGCALAMACLFWILVGIPPVGLRTPQDVSGLILLLLAPFLPALFIGRLLGPKLADKGFWRTIGWQALVNVGWSLFNAFWAFLVLFFGDIRNSIFGSDSVHSLFSSFWNGFGSVSILFYILLFPVTLASSWIALILIRRSGPMQNSI
jgi:hypothetical protein